MARLDHLGPVKEAAQIRVSDRRARAWRGACASLFGGYRALELWRAPSIAAGARRRRSHRRKDHSLLHRNGPPVDSPGRNVPFRLCADPPGRICRGHCADARRSRRLRAMGTGLTLPSLFAALADALARRGKTDEGSAAAAEGLSMAAEGDRLSLPEIHRIKGKLLLDRSARDREAAEAAFRRAIEIARAQEARSLELRARQSGAALGREWQAGPR